MAKKTTPAAPGKTVEPLTKSVSREELYVLIKGFDGVKVPFSPLSRKLFSVYRLNRDVFEEVDKVKKEYDLNLEEYNKKLYEIVQKYADKDESGKLKSKVNNLTGDVNWTFTNVNGPEGLEKIEELKKEYKDYLKYAESDSYFQKFMKEPVTLTYFELLPNEILMLNAASLIYLLPIFPPTTKIAENALPEEITFEQMKILSKKIEIK
jgi:hypothetical protein